MKKHVRKTIPYLSILICLTISLCFLLPAGKQFVRGESTTADYYTGYVNFSSESELYNYSNTYRYTGTPNTNNKQAYYNVSSQGKTGISVSNEAYITVLTHGLGQGAKTWSNQFSINGSDKFAYMQDTLVADFVDREDCIVYWAKTNSAISGNRKFKLINISKQPKSNVYSEDKDYLTNKLPGIDKHIVLVFEAQKPNAKNNAIYEEFNYILSRIIADVRYLNGGKLPKVNLIGHSRGGITNLQFALDHPDLVDSIFGIGTPYMGSETAKTKIGQMIGSGAETVSELNNLSVDQQGVFDIIDAELYTSYYERWKTTMVGGVHPYKSINAYALGGYSTLEYLLTEIKKYADAEIESDIIGKLIVILCDIAEHHPTQFLKKLHEISVAAEILVPYIHYKGLTAVDVREAILALSPEISISAGDVALELLNRLFAASNIWYLQINTNPIFMGDLLVDLPSQLGVNKNNENDYRFETYSKCFNNDNCDKTRLASNNPAVVHNLEPQDSDFVNFIISRLSLQHGDNFVYYPVTQNSVGIKSCAMQLDSVTATESSPCDIVIPEVWNGKTVVEIGQSAFADNIFGQNKWFNVTIPKSVTKIRKSAFSNCTMLKNVTFASSDKLTEIDNRAFENCSALSALSIPSTVTRIGDYALANTGIEGTLTLPVSLTSIGQESFINCKKMTAFAIAANDHYQVSGNILYSKSLRTLISCPAGLTISNPSKAFNINIMAKEISSGAFSGVEALRSIDLKNAEIIRDNAFRGCVNLQSIVANGVLKTSYQIQCSTNAFCETKWYKEQAGFLVLQDCLIGYNGTATKITASDIPTKVKQIADFAFAGSNLEEIVLPDTIQHIGKGAFLATPNLSKVTILGKPYVGEYCFDKENEGLSILLVDEYMQESDYAAQFSDYSSKLKPATAKIVIVEDGQERVVTIPYGESYTLPEDANVTWYDANGQVITEVDTWQDLSGDLLATAKYSVTVTYLTQFGDTIFNLPAQTKKSLTRNAAFKMPEWNNNYYTIVYWEDQLGNTYLPGKSIDFSMDVTLYGRMQENVYNIIYFGASYADNFNPTTYTHDDAFYFTDLPDLPYFRFAGWYWEYSFMTEAEGIAINSSGTKRVYARWEFYLTFIRSGVYTITDSGRQNQPYDIIDITEIAKVTANDLTYAAYQVFTITFEFDMREIYDGYQYIFLYTQKGSDDVGLIDSKTIEYGGSGKNSTFGRVSFEFIIQSSFLQNSGNKLYFLYGASGGGRDDWENKNLSITVTCRQTQCIEGAFMKGEG